MANTGRLVCLHPHRPPLNPPPQSKCRALSALIHLHPWIGTFGKVHLSGGRNVRRGFFRFQSGRDLRETIRNRSPRPGAEPLCFIHLTHILIRPFKAVRHRQLWSPDICFHIAEFRPIFPSTPTNSPPSFLFFAIPSLFSNHVWKNKKIKIIKARLGTYTCVFLWVMFPLQRHWRRERELLALKMLIKCTVAGKDTWECMH